MEIDKIAALERLNPEYTINVFAVEGREIYYLETQAWATINLLMIKQDGWKHYTLIKNMNCLCLKGISEHEHHVKICC